ncbi:hypothetical protein GCM10009555_032920 [Acrocarpospora macrocephala]|uniref:Protein kinase domain-containing protein n=1 Tax=Acrocarpospora macrocephala TaxID=150177 RepID=A0A5M3WH91_9ACTN|nr:hypothetical protein [Acrocarpospora macrocephala]GES06473.1 hypothetical protein Amac_000680 [Acrocarpospora macrocephala]
MTSSDATGRSELVLGDRLNSGGQGVVHELLGPETGYVFKAYNPSLLPVNGAALQRLVDFPEELTEADREFLMRQTAWPLACVIECDQVRGFVMRRVPERFWGDTPAGPRLRELQYLLYERKPLWGDIAPLAIEDRLDVARQTAELFRFLHSRRLVVGDVSMRNLLWSPRPVTVFLLDCDGITISGEPGVLPQPTTPDWTDPYEPHSGPDIDTDRYKLALLIARVLTRNPYLLPSQRPDFLPGLPAQTARNVEALFARAAGPPGERSSAAAWVRALIPESELSG